MKQLKILLLLLLFFVCLSENAFADLAADVENRYNSLKSWSADFDQTTFVEMLNLKLSKKGKIYVARPNQLRIEYTTKPSKIYVSNGKKLWIYKNSDNTAWQFNKPKKVISKEAWSFLSGLKDLSSIFDIIEDLNEPKGSLRIKNKRLKKLFLIPKNKGASVLKITLGVDPKNLIVKEAVLFNSSGNTTHYVFKNICFDKNLSSQLFVLPKEPKRKIIKK